MLELASAALAEAGLGAVLLRSGLDRPLLEVLLDRAAERRAAWAALDTLPWRWRYGGDGAWQALPRRAWYVDGGVLLVAHAALPDAPWRPGATRRLAAAVRGTPPARPGIRPADPDLQVVRAAVELAQADRPYREPHEELAALLQRPGADGWRRRAGEAGLERPVAPVVAAAQGLAAGTWPPAPRRRPAAERLGRRLRASLPGRAGRLARGRPLDADVVRCRFAGLELLAGRGVFLPRRVSEPLVDAVVELLDGLGRPGAVADVGTGCGAVALAVAAARPSARVVATELDGLAASWARRNARRLGLPVSVRVGSLLEPLLSAGTGRLDVVVGNVPCLLPGQDADVRDAGSTAYVGRDADGLGLHRALLEQAGRALAPGGRVLVQLQPHQWAALRPFADGAGYSLEVTHSDDVAHLCVLRSTAVGQRAGRLEPPTG